ncbi:MAG: monofunctional biosynthetic peptidoglycan transglycosylase [Acidobacteriota bacterium]|nr:monofunctional biosynthetic peptidoglycan transglycosylase [Acidobacteriota bacterium]
MAGGRRRGRGAGRRRVGAGRWWRRSLLAVAAVAMLFAAQQAWTWPDVTELARSRPATTAFISRARDRGVGVVWRWAPYEEISPHLKRAVLVAEDINFFGHAGFETTEIRTALVKAAQEREAPRGASTITQQLAKNLWLSSAYSPLRKAKEALLTWQLERELGKRRILELYLGVAQFGPRVFGAEAAAQVYFGKPAAELTEREAAELAAGLPRPSRWNPRSDSQAYRERVEEIERRMERADWLWSVI